MTNVRHLAFHQWSIAPGPFGDGEYEVTVGFSVVVSQHPSDRPLSPLQSHLGFKIDLVTAPAPVGEAAGLIKDKDLRHVFSFARPIVRRKIRLTRKGLRADFVKGTTEIYPFRGTGYPVDANAPIRLEHVVPPITMGVQAGDLDAQSTASIFHRDLFASPKADPADESVFAIVSIVDVIKDSVLFKQRSHAHRKPCLVTSVRT